MSIFLEYNTQIFQMTLFNVQMISDISSIPGIDSKTYLVGNIHLWKGLMNTDAKVSACRLHHAELKRIYR